MFGERYDWEPPKESCLTCRYYGFVGLDRWCLHPEHDRRIKKPRKKCKSWIDRFSKEPGPEKLKKNDARN
jgi:hypothetical protein